MDDALPDTVNKGMPNVVFRKDRHLSSALIITEIEYMFENEDNPRALKYEHRALLQHLRSKSYELSHSDLFYAWCMKQALGDHGVSHTNVTELMTLFRASEGGYRLAHQDWTFQTATTTPLNLPRLITQMYDRKTKMDDLFDAITYDTRMRVQWDVWGMEGVAYGNLHLVKKNVTEAFVISHAHLAGVRDMISAWFDALLYSHLSNNKYEGVQLYQEVVDCINLAVMYACDYPVDVYVLMKMWPSLCIGAILRDTEDYDVFLNALRADIPNPAHPLVRWILRPITTDQDVHVRLELSGLWKIFGHPIIDMEASITSWVEKGTVLKHNKRNMGERCSNMLKLTMCRRYFEERHRWPPLKLSGKEAEHVRKSYTRGTWDETPSDPWRSKDFEGVRFEKTFEFNMYVDPSDLLSDTSIIPSRSHWVYEFDAQAHRTLYGHFPNRPPFASKSVIISYLSQEDVDVSGIINTINTGNVPKEWKVIIAVAKEREHKRTNARFYAKMTPEMRLYQIATEGNIADTIFKYIKEQSMTMGEEQLLRTITRMTSPHTDPTKSKYKFVVIDFSSWYTNFRWEFSQGVFRDLDDLFGFNMVYQYTHLFHLTSILLFQDRFGPPEQSPFGDPYPSKRCIYSPEAWQEGLRQKGWTLITIMLIHLAAETCNTTASLLGQGDNQVVLLRIPPASYLTRTNQTEGMYVNNFVNVLTEYAEEAGIPIKPLETWRAQNLFEYSRKYHYKGAQVSCALKKISRLSSEANQVIPTLNGDLSGLYSTGASAASEDVTPKCAYITTLVESMHLIRRAMPWLKDRACEHSLILATNTRALGGLPVTSYPNFCMRAVQDPLSTGLHWLYTLLDCDTTRGPTETLIRLTKKRAVDYESLIKDPSSLPLATPLQSEHYLRDMIRVHLPNIIKNNAVRNLFDFAAEDQKRLLVEDLVSMTPFNPRLASKLYALSNFGLQEKYISKFSGARSIQQATLTAWKNEAEVLQSVKAVESANSEALQGREQTPLPCKEMYEPGHCLTQLAQNLRDEMWRLNLEGITMPAQQEQTRLYRWNDIPVQWASRSILVIVDESVNHCASTTRGKNTPYYGSATKMRVRRAPMQVLEVGNLVSSLKQLMELKGWVKGDEGIERLISTLITEKTTVSMDTLNLYTRQVYSGAISHRLPCQALKRGGMTNQNLNFSSHVRIISDTALAYAKSGTNYTICFQSAFLYALSALSQLQEAGVNISGKWGLVFLNTCCVREIPPETFSLPDTKYKGVELQNKIDLLRPKYEVMRTLHNSSIGGRESYSVIMARKFTMWIKNIDLSTRISTLENRAIHESLTAPFVNLTEFVHLECRQFFLSLIYFHYLYDETTRESPHLLWEPVLSGGNMKTAYDVLADSLTKCGLLRPWASITGKHLLVEGGREGLRALLATTLSHLCKVGWRRIVSENSILTQDDTDVVYTIASRLLHYAHGVMWPYLDKVEYTTLVEHMREQGSLNLLPICTVSEEEAVCVVRSMSAPEHHVQVPDDRYPSLEHHTYATGGQFNTLYNNMAGCVGYSVLHTSFYQLFTGVNRDAFKRFLPYTTLHLYTHDDSQGELYTYLTHLLLYCWSDLKRVYGHPMWEIDDDDIEMIVNEGPTRIALDPCKVRYDMLRFQGNITGRRQYRDTPNTALHVWKITPVQDDPEWQAIPDRSLVLINHTETMELPKLLSLWRHRTLVRTKGNKVWVFGRKDNRLGCPNTLNDEDEVMSPTVGFSSAREALEYACESTCHLSGCYSLMTWVRTKMSEPVSSRRSLHNAVDNMYKTFYRRLTSIRIDSAQRSNLTSSVMSDLLYWSWVHMCGVHSPDLVATHSWRAKGHVSLRGDHYKVCLCNIDTCTRIEFSECHWPRILKDQWIWYAVWRSYGAVEPYRPYLNYVPIILNEV